MIDFTPFRSILKLQDIVIDNNVFRLHYKLTVVSLLIFSLLVTSKQFFGDPIHCTTGKHAEDKEVINNFCWIHGTFTVKKHWNGIVGKSVADYGIGNEHGEEQQKHKYYQWVCFALLVQAGFFYLPRYLWKIWEGGRIRLLAADLVGPIAPTEWSSRKNQIVAYLSQKNNFTHNLYAARFAFCELLNMLNVISQIFALDYFLGGSFQDYGPAVLRHFWSPVGDMAGPTEKYFPTVTMCKFHYFGPSGDIVRLELLCILPLNIVNEKIFIILWFWLVFLAFLSCLAVVYRLLTYILTPFRVCMIMGQIRYVPRYTVQNIVNQIPVGDWFVLHQLGKNLNPLIFKEVILEFGRELDRKPILI